MKSQAEAAKKEAEAVTEEARQAKLDADVAMKEREEMKAKMERL